jgi:DNA-binding CsgD family transcriptional regulator
LLANEVAAGPLHGAWGGLVSALQRHTVHGELSQLSKEDSRILSLAYLHGHTNREIAQMLDVSVSTVRRRLAIALSRLERSMRRAGLWTSVLALGALTLYGRLAHAVRTTAVPATVAAVAAGSVTAVTLGVVAVGPAATPVLAAAPPQQVREAGALLAHVVGGSAPSPVRTTTPTTPTMPTTPTTPTTPATPAAKSKAVHSNAAAHGGKHANQKGREGGGHRST